MNNKIKVILIIVFLAVAAVLSCLIFAGIRKPIKFEEDKQLRFDITIERLKDIKEAQRLYKEQTGNYTNSFDTLVEFINNGKLKVVQKIGFVPDSLTEKEALKLGIVKRDTILLSVLDTLLSTRKTYKKDGTNYLPLNLKELSIIPVGKKTPFIMDTASVLTGSGVVLKVFQCYTLYDDVLDNLDKQLIINLKQTKKESIISWVKEQVTDSLNNTRDTLVLKEIMEKACIRLGKLDEANNNAGNWD
ncbi:MAG: hypothetical protein LBV69_06635 [Bacteroidales bacterium]|jgi:hypothetical protein|nr:hypothetical protein [Bacteroidales bacterium]